MQTYAADQKKSPSFVGVQSQATTGAAIRVSSNLKEVERRLLDFDAPNVVSF
jgi:hypothetical protein